MKKIFSNYRYYVLTVLATVAVIGILSVPAEGLPAADWCGVLISSKVIGFCAICIIAKLIKRWEREGTISELIKTINKDF